MKDFRTVLMAALVVVALAGIAIATEHPKDESKEATVKGEVIDLVCYLDHLGMGEKHAQCAKTCIEGGLPVGLKGEDGKVYLLVGEHKPVNATLASLAAKTVTLKGKLVTRDGINMLENVQVVTQ